MRSVYRPCRTLCLRLHRTGSVQRHDAGVLSVLPPSSGGAADRLNPVGVCDVCGCVRGALRRGRKWNKSLPRSEIGERDLVAEGERGKTATDWWQWREQASYHRMYTTWNVWLGRHKQDNLITNYYLLSTIYLEKRPSCQSSRHKSMV